MIDLYKQCPRCQGKGGSRGSIYACPECNGKGFVRVTADDLPELKAEVQRLSGKEED